MSKYGWRRAIFAEILLFGSRAVIPFSKSTSNSFKDAVCCYIGIPLNFGNVDLKSFVIQNSDGDDFTLTHKQIKLLKLFIEKKDQVISRQEILEKVWGYDVYPSSRTIDNFVLLFRKVFEKNLPSSTYFKSVRGVGYKFTP